MLQYFISDEILYYENFHLEKVITPVDVNELESLLVESNYDKAKSAFLLDGFKNGFGIGYNGNENVQPQSPNLKFRGVGSKLELWNKVMKEVKLKRYEGPFSKIPYDHYIQSPIGLVPKDGKRYQTNISLILS